MSDQFSYLPPKVWAWNKANGGRFANINRPVAGATHEKTLPRGKHPLQLYSLGTPNGVKVTVMLEELLALGHLGAEYDAWLIRINDGDQFGSGFVGVNPNSKIPALLDCSSPQPIRVFESGSILLYLAEKFSAFVPTDVTARAECLSWLFWQMGSAPFSVSYTHLDVYKRQGMTMRSISCRPRGSNRHNSTLVAFSENNAKLTPSPSHEAPRG